MEGKRVLHEKYEMGRLLGKGNFGKVYHARQLKTGESVAIKSMCKVQIQKEGIMDQVMREISAMQLVKHPNIVEIKEVMATKTKIYIVMEYIKGGDLLTKLNKEIRISEDLGRRYFQQLIRAVDFCHSRGVYHRDLKLENILLDETGNNIKVADFGLSAILDQSERSKGAILQTMCGAPAYVAPEVLRGKGYNGEKSDIWSCGVILYTLLAGHLPFQKNNIVHLYRRILSAMYQFPPKFPHQPKLLIQRMLLLNLERRVGVQEIMNNPWFKRGFVRSLGTKFEENVPDRSLEIETASSSHFCNAFDLISSMASGLDLTYLFENKHKAGPIFTSKFPISKIISRIKEFGKELNYEVTRITQFEVKLEEGQKGRLSVMAKVFEVAPEVAIVEFSKINGDTLDYIRFCEKEAKLALADIICTWQEDSTNSYLASNEK